MNSRRRAAIVSAAGLLLLGCAGQDLAVRASGVRNSLHKARENGAYQCAPRPLALSEANVEFAERELDRGEYFRALDHIEIAEAKAREVLRLSPAGGCGKPVVVAPAPPSTLDTDGDGIPDVRDSVPTSQRTRTGLRTRMAAPTSTTTRTVFPTRSTSAPTNPRTRTVLRTRMGALTLTTTRTAFPTWLTSAPTSRGHPKKTVVPRNTR